MLKNIPRVITVGLILLFSLPIAIQHLGYLVFQVRDYDSSSASLDSKRLFKRHLENATRLFSWLERVDYDLHVTRSNPGPMSPNVAVVEINERSLKDLGQFPFTRTIYKQFLERLERAGAKVVAFDVTFPERDSRREMIDELARIRHEIEQREGFDSQTVRHLDNRIFELDADEDFATALSKSRLPIVLGFTISDAMPETADVRDQEQLKKDKAMLFGYELRRRNLLETGAITPFWGMPVISIEKIMSSLNKASSIGHINPDIDEDSVIRSIPAVLEYEGHVFGSLGLRAIAAYFGEDPVLDGSDGVAIQGMRAGEGGDAGAQLGRLRFPLNSDGTFRLRYYGPSRAFPYIEFSDIVKDRFSEEQLREKVGGKIIFVGATALGLKDLRATPFSASYPGVETHATMASNVLQGSYLLRDQRMFFVGYLLLWVFGALASWAVYRFHPLTAFGVALGSMVVIQWVAHLCYNHGVEVLSILPSLACLMLFFSGVLYRYFTEEKEKKAVRAAFSRYVSSAVVEEILKDGRKLELGGRKKELTVMFVDLVAFTKVAEHRDASFVTQLLNEYFTRMTRIILQNQGTLDKYMGDAILCFWGAPLELNDHAKLACKAALEMRAELERINHEWKHKHGIAIENRIGINSADVAVGNMGSDQVFSYTVMGDGVNLASRLERVNNVYGTHVVVSQNTAVKAGNGFLFRPLDRVQVKGKEDAVDILELVSMKAEKEPEWIHAFRTGLNHYLAGEWDDAESAFGACLTLKPNDGPSQIFIERIQDFRIVAPDEWKGVWKLSSK